MKKGMKKGIQNKELSHIFLSNAISNVSSWIQLIDTKVSIIMGVIVALISAYAPVILKKIYTIKLYSVYGFFEMGILIICFIALLGLIYFGILTLRPHNVNVVYSSKWYIDRSIEDYSLDLYLKELNEMTEIDFIENMAVELYKLNDINRQKVLSYKWMIRYLAMLILSVVFLFIMIFFEK